MKMSRPIRVALIYASIGLSLITSRAAYAQTAKTNTLRQMHPAEMIGIQSIWIGLKLISEFGVHNFAKVAAEKQAFLTASNPGISEVFLKSATHTELAAGEIAMLTRRVSSLSTLSKIASIGAAANAAIVMLSFVMDPTELNAEEFTHVSNRPVKKRPPLTDREIKQLELEIRKSNQEMIRLLNHKAEQDRKMLNPPASLTR